MLCLCASRTMSRYDIYTRFLSVMITFFSTRDCDNQTFTVATETFSSRAVSTMLYSLSPSCSSCSCNALSLFASCSILRPCLKASRARSSYVIYTRVLSVSMLLPTPLSAIHLLIVDNDTPRVNAALLTVYMSNTTLHNHIISHTSHTNLSHPRRRSILFEEES